MRTGWLNSWIQEVREEVFCSSKLVWSPLSRFAYCLLQNLQNSISNAELNHQDLRPWEFIWPSHTMSCISLRSWSLLGLFCSFWKTYPWISWFPFSSCPQFLVLKLLDVYDMNISFEDDGPFKMQQKQQARQGEVVDRSQDIRIIQIYYKHYRERHRIDQLEEEARNRRPVLSTDLLPERWLTVFCMTFSKRSIGSACQWDVHCICANN